MPLELATRSVKVGKHEIRITEFTTEQLSEIKSKSLSLVKSRPVTDLVAWESYSLLFAIDPETWPTEEWCAFTIEGIRKLPARVTKPILTAISALNRLDVDETDFLDTRSSSPELEIAPSSMPSASLKRAKGSASQLLSVKSSSSG